MPVTISGTTGIAGVDGSAGTPAVQGADSNTGVFFPAADTVAIATGGSERLRADSSGNVGIGTTSPATPLNIYTAAARTDFRLSTGKSSGELAAFQCFGLNSSSASVGYAQIVAAASSSTAGSHSGYLAFETAVSGSLAERARIDGSGNLLVGDTATVSGAGLLVKKSNPERVIHVENTRNTSGDQVYRSVLGSNCNNTSSYHLVATTGGTDRCYIYGNGNLQNSNNSYGGISDAKLKENVVDATPKLEKLNHVRIVNFNLIGDQQKQIGVIAQELEQIFPGMVEESPDRDAEGNDLGTTTKSVKYSVFVPMLIKAMQEQQALIESLTARIAALEGAAQ
jgi:hypothetical protein